MRKPFKPGQSGNPAGRPRGARSKFSEDFLGDFHTVWKTEGIETLRRLAKQKNPVAFMRAAIAILPTRFDISSDSALSAEESKALFDSLLFDIELARRVRRGDADSSGLHTPSDVAPDTPGRQAEHVQGQWEHVLSPGAPRGERNGEHRRGRRTLEAQSAHRELKAALRRMRSLISLISGDD